MSDNLIILPLFLAMSYITKRPSYFYKFDRSNHAIIPIVEHVNCGQSVWFSGFDNVIGNIDRNYYVLCVVYFKDGKMQDTQLGITGYLMKKKIQ